MKRLKVSGNQIVTEQGAKFFIKGVNVGGWLNMEDFINGYPGSPSSLRKLMEKRLGKNKSDYFFERLEHHFFNEEDIKLIKSCGLNTLRIPLNYRHFENDMNPFNYEESGFEKLDNILELCEKHEIYVILDLHAVQGYQNTHWHSDNISRHSFFWDDKLYQDRFIELWKEFAQRYKDRNVIAGYDLMNEPAVNTPHGDYPHTYFENYEPKWKKINDVYKRAVNEIRKIDSSHIIILEGDSYSRLFEGLEAPFAKNLVYSSHNYTAAGFGPGKYPGEIKPRNLNAESGDTSGNTNANYWDRERQVEEFEKHEGTIYTKKHDVPLIITEFGSVYNGPEEEVPFRLEALEDQLSIFNERDAHWTIWPYKDVGIMGLAMLSEESSYMKRISKVIDLKEKLNTDDWMKWLPGHDAKNILNDLSNHLVDLIGDEELNPAFNLQSLSSHVLTTYVATMLQPSYVKAFEGLSKDEIDETLQSFSIENCKINEELADVFKSH